MKYPDFPENYLIVNNEQSSMEQYFSIQACTKSDRFFNLFQVTGLFLKKMGLSLRNF